jgi:hypothetical protein
MLSRTLKPRRGSQNQPWRMLQRNGNLRVCCGECRRELSNLREGPQSLLWRMPQSLFQGCTWVFTLSV